MEREPRTCPRYLSPRRHAKASLLNSWRAGINHGGFLFWISFLVIKTEANKNQIYFCFSHNIVTVRKQGQR